LIKLNHQLTQRRFALRGKFMLRPSEDGSRTVQQTHEGKAEGSWNSAKMMCFIY
jgi:hypothetical protein